ncbi:GumC family protein [Hyphococcus sp.]|uniref:GumC family protein n=1 Tax=Hyphococcus sp. TaxID=2038636 RepID=UPI003CCBD945
MGDEFTLEDALIILKRRILYFLIPALVIAPIGVITVMLLPAKYTAQGTILVESQQIPTEFIRSTINAYAQERIQTIRQRVMTRNRLLQVADEHNLFPRELGLSETERVQRMRSQLRVDLITTSANRGSGDGTIAFTVAYTDRNPRNAYLVANKFMTLFLDEDVRARTTGASNTTEFFERETARLRNAVSQLENRVSEYKTENSGALPEQLNTNLDMLERAQRELSSAQSSISQLEEERRFLENQLISGGAGDNSMTSELARLESELARLRATYQDTYPEVRAKRDEIAALKRRMAPSAEITKLRDELTASEDRLTELERAPEPDAEAIAEAETDVEAARTALSERITEESRRGANDLAGVQLEGRIAVVENRIRMLNKQSDSASQKIIALEERIERTPEIERGLAALTRDYENMFQEYQDILTKQQDAQLAENLEENQQAEKFSILEPALNPEEPSSPDRAKLIFAALVAAIGVGAATAFGVEMFKSRLRGRNHISNVLDGQPIAIIPYIHGEKERRLRLPFIGRRKKHAHKRKRPAARPEAA